MDSRRIDMKIKSIIAVMIVFALAALADNKAERLTVPERVSEAQIDAGIDYNKLTDEEIDKIKNIDDVKAYLKKLTAATTVKHKARLARDRKK